MRARRARSGAGTRRGYTVMLVLVFLIILLSVLGLTYRNVSAVLRLEAARSRQILRDEGALQAAARGVKMLESGPPPTDPFTVTLGVTTSSGARSYDVTLASEPAFGAGCWVVSAAPSAP